MRKWFCGRGILKLAKVVGTGLNQKAISGGMGKVVKVVGAGGNLKAISGVMGRDFRNLKRNIECFGGSENSNRTDRSEKRPCFE